MYILIGFFSFLLLNTHTPSHALTQRELQERDFFQPFCHCLCRPLFSKTWICDVILDSITYCISVPYQASLNIAFLFQS